MKSSIEVLRTIADFYYKTPRAERIFVVRELMKEKRWELWLRKHFPELIEEAMPIEGKDTLRAISKAG